MEGDTDVHMKQRCEINFLSAENILPVEIHWGLKNVYRDNCVDVSTGRRWVRQLSDGEYGVKNLPR
jgi:hypothetical protein